jgi:hypothetical protein
MKTKKNQVEVVEVLVNVLGVTINAKFEKSDSRYYADIPREQAGLCYSRAVELLRLRQWQSNIHIEVFGSCSGDEYNVRFWCYREVDNVLIQYSLTIEVFESSGAQLIVGGGPSSVRKFVLKDMLSEQNELIMFSFSRSDRELFSKLENEAIIEKLISEGLLVKQGEFLMFSGKREKQEVINGTSI